MKKINNIIAEKLRAERYDIDKTTYFDYQATTPCDVNVLLAMIPFFGCDVSSLMLAERSNIVMNQSNEVYDIVHNDYEKEDVIKNAQTEQDCYVRENDIPVNVLSASAVCSAADYYNNKTIANRETGQEDTCKNSKNNQTECYDRANSVMNADGRKSEMMSAAAGAYNSDAKQFNAAENSNSMENINTDIIFGNPHARSHVYGWAAEKSMEYARAQIAESINTDEECIIFTSGATESNNLAIKGLCEFWKSKKKHILTTEIEHKCALEAVKFMQRNGFEVTYVQVHADGTLDLNAFEQAIRPDTLMLSISAVNHEIGTVQNMEAIGQICRRKGIFLHVDAAQGWGKLDIDVEKWNVDLMSLSAHKTYGPKGIGALYIRCSPKRVRIQPIIHGGGQERGFRSGTMPVPLCIGMGTAAELFCTNRHNMMLENIRVWLLHAFFLKQIDKITHIYLNGPRIDNITIADLDFIQICQNLSEYEYLRETCMGIYNANDMKKEQASNMRSHDQKSTMTIDVKKLQELHQKIIEKRIPHNINISILGIEGESLMMEMRDFAFSSGSACTSANLEPSYVLQEIGVKEELLHSSIRVSFGRQTTAQDIINFTTSMQKAVQKLRDMSPVWECVLEDRPIDSWNIDQK